MKCSLTVIIPTLNEENYLKHAIQNALFADEVIIIDSYSTDDTLKIAEGYGCRILQRAFDDFSSQKNYALSFAKHKWVFILDADEYISPLLQEEISELIKHEKHHAFKLPRLNFFMNRFLKYGSSGNDTITRLFNKERSHYEGFVHERLIHDGELGKMQNILYHYTYRGLEHFKQKKDKYSTFQAEQKTGKVKTITFYHLVVKPAFRFYKEFVIRLGFLDGLPGLTTTRMNCYGVLSRYVKLRGLQNKNKDKRLQNYDTFSALLMQEARGEAAGSATFSSLIAYYFLPKATFLNHYFLKGECLKGLEGYTISYLYSFKTYQRLVFSWLNKRNLD